METEEARGCNDILDADVAIVFVVHYYKAFLIASNYSCLTKGTDPDPLLVSKRLYNVSNSLNIMVRTSLSICTMQ